MTLHSLIFQVTGNPITWSLSAEQQRMDANGTGALHSPTSPPAASSEGTRGTWGLAAEGTGALLDGAELWPHQGLSTASLGEWTPALEGVMPEREVSRHCLQACFHFCLF